MTGGAIFSPCQRYRPMLWRSWGCDNDMAPSWLWIGMNPSVADVDVDAPTCRREVGFTRRAGMTLNVKCNVADWRATDPKVFRHHDIEPRSAENLQAIMQAAHTASRVIAAWGDVPKPLRPYATDTAAMLLGHGIKLWCLGMPRSGAPRHPLYVRSDTPLVAWKCVT
ncbi:MAG TPA: DUF1643 domain-containing protein [Acetobacteraceae bacterium]|nr:DUF1643 domain-containing protein [Acetobacteraceae bacterium]